MADDFANPENTDQLRDACAPCTLIEELIETSAAFSSALYDILVILIIPIFIALVGVWAILTAVRLIYGTQEPKQLLIDLSFISIAFLLLVGDGKSLILDTFNLILNGTGLLGLAALSVATQGGEGAMAAIGQENAFITLMRSTQNALWNILMTGLNVSTMGGGFITGLSNFFLGIVLIIPFWLLLIAFIAQTLVLFFRLTILSAFSSLLLMAYGFRWGRGMAIEAFKTALASSMVYFSTCVVFALILFAVNRLGINSLALNNPDEILSVPFLVALVLGYAGPPLIIASVELANSITKASLSNTAAGLTTAGLGAASIMAAKRMGGASGLAGGAGAIKAAQSLGKAMGMEGKTMNFQSGGEAMGFMAGAAGQAMGQGVRKMRNVIGGLGGGNA